ncbi:hypothetical protein [Acinetobacter boissieri]|uniref:Uncharacterized protein n=1 Tax=Acinetobacter boissieri TaxID=1219383 RepID=A0A1G6HZ50_9GAMM|nr:hypothetical protein [Acinetobacter boissieri]SDB99470.1 hypothetical protein SAMN05421733_107126 [Acinetobacter boissieri]
MKIKHIAISLLTLISTPVFADQCEYPHNEPALLGDGSIKIIRQQARNTWDDWVWRGRQSDGQPFRCPSVGTQSCMYMWSKAQTTGYSWAVGGTFNADKIPVIGAFLPGSINGNYSKNKSITTTFGWNVTVQPGYSAEPIQVIQRRWMRGVYKGAFVQTGGMCSGAPDWAHAIWPKRHSMYRWDANRITGSWSSNIEVGKFATYHIYKY